MTEKTEVYAFVGPSGTGKSYRAQMVANSKGIEYIIDDGLLILGNEVVAGSSAKKAPTKIETVKNALFLYLIEDFFELHIYSQIKLLSLHQTLINLHGEPK